jgi:hypothetical protein
MKYECKVDTRYELLGEFLMPQDALMMLQFFVRLHFPDNSGCESKLMVAILNYTILFPINT